MSAVNYETSAMAFQKLVQHWRKAMGYTRKEAADALGVPGPTLDGWIIGRACGQERSMRKLMQCLKDKA